MAMQIPEIPNTRLFPHAQLADFTTFQLGGPCRCLIECSTVDALTTLIKSLIAQNKPFILIGGGSNVVVSDHGIDLIVIRYISQTPLIVQQENSLTISGSTFLDHAAIYSVEHCLDGLVFTSGIPGTIGGAVLGNAGAWGKQVGDILTSALIIDDLGNLKEVDPDYFGFSYRHSRLKETKDIIAQVTFKLDSGDAALLALERAEILKKRNEKHPNLSVQPCAGSFFRNIEPTSKADKRQATGWFLEEAGGKDLRVGGAYIFDKHANIIIKDKNGTAQNIYELHLKMIDIVKAKFGFTLSREVRFLGRFNNVDVTNSQWFW